MIVVTLLKSCLNKNHIDIGEFIVSLKSNQNWLMTLYHFIIEFTDFLLCAIWKSLYSTKTQRLTQADPSFIISILPSIGTIIIE